jgi:hypothetical protein
MTPKRVWVLVSLVVGSLSLFPGCSDDGGQAGNGDAPGVVTLRVDGRAPVGGEGSEAAPFHRLQDAVSAARVASAAGAVIIEVAPLGDEAYYPIDPGEPLLLDFPVTLRGGLQLVRDADGWATGEVVEGTETRLLAVPPLAGAERLVDVTADGVTLEGLTFSANDAGLAGTALVALDGADDFLIRGCVFTGGPFVAVQPLDSSGAILDNFITGVGCGTCIAGGRPERPARVRFEGNRSVENVFGGVLLAGQLGRQDIGYGNPGRGTLEATIRRNDLSNNTALPGFSFGVRVFLARDEQFRLDAPPGEDVEGHIVATIAENRIANNAWAVWIDAGFPFREDPRGYGGTLDVTFEGNQLVGNTSMGVVSFTRNTAASDFVERESWEYAVGAEFRLTYGEAELGELAIDHPSHEPYTGAELGNRLTINGVDAPAGAPLVPADALWPSGGDDTAALQVALNSLAARGPGATLQLGEGTFRVSRPLVTTNLDATIQGAGMDETAIIADGTVGDHPEGLFANLPLDEAEAIGLGLGFPFLLVAAESDVDRLGRSVPARSTRLTVTDLTLGAHGVTESHYDVNENADTRRLFSFVWMVGARGGWTNSAGQTPSALGAIDEEHRQISTSRASFARVRFDGRNRAPERDGGADDASEPGGPYSAAPDVRNAFGIEGGLDLISPPPDPDFFFKPINADLEFIECEFTSLPGQSGIFAPQVVGRDDPAWSFGPDAVAGRIEVRDSTFRDVTLGVLVPELSDVAVTVTGSSFTGGAFGVLATASYQALTGRGIGYPAASPSTVEIRGSFFEGAAVAAVLVEESVAPAALDLHLADSAVVLAGPGQMGLIGFGLAEPVLADNTFSGQGGYAAVVAVGGTGWSLTGTDFCELDVPENGEPPFSGLPMNETGAAVLLVDTSGGVASDNECYTVEEHTNDPQ